MVTPPGDDAPPTFHEKMAALAAMGWNPLAPWNRAPDGRLFRKVRIGHTWLWLRVVSLDALAGVSENTDESLGLAVGDWVAFALTPDGFAVATDASES